MQPQISLSALLLLVQSFQSTYAAPAVVSLQHSEAVQISCAAAPQGTVTVTVYQPSSSGPASSTATSRSSSSIGTSLAQTSSSAASNSVSASLTTSRTPSASPTLSPPSGGQNTTGTNGQFTNALYFTNWGIYGANYQPQQLPANQVTHVLYAFADIKSDGSVVSSDPYADFQKHYPTDSWNDQGNNAYGCIKQLYLLKKQNRHMKVLLSIGGWTYSSKFPPIAASATTRQQFANTAVQLVKDWGFDGIDIDWEYPANPTEAQNFVLLLQACRQALDAYAAASAPGYHFLITVASPAGSSHYNTMDLVGMNAYVDHWHLMAYDYAGSWDSVSGHQANLYTNPSNMAATQFSTDAAIRAYVAKGIQASKVILGLPLYGHVFDSNSGLGKSYSGTGGGDGIALYNTLPKAGAVEMWDDVAQASYSYDSAKQELITYDTVRSATNKAQYLKSQGLGGAMFWEASGDKTGAQSLVGTLASLMGSLDATQNLLSYPASQYDNIKAGMP